YLGHQLNYPWGGVKYQNDTCHVSQSVPCHLVACSSEAPMVEKTQMLHIRVPMAFHRKLMRAADHNGQTLNAEILRRLQESFETATTLKSVEDMLKMVGDDLSRKSEELKKIFMESYMKQMDKTEKQDKPTGGDDEQGQHQEARRE